MSSLNAPASQVNELPIQIIEPPKRWVPLDIGELWRYRDLIFFFVFRDIKVRYQQTILGVLWAIIQPFITMIVFTFVFGRIAQMPSDGIPYPLFSYVGLLPWNFFSDGLTKASSSLVTNATMIRKIYFPRLILPITAILSGIIDLLIAGAMLLLIYVYYALSAPPVPQIIKLHAYPLVNPAFAETAFAHASRNFEITGNILWLPALLLLAFIVALGLSLWLAALNVRFRDVGYALGFFVRILMYVTPVAYPLSRLDGPMQWITALNPMTGVVEGFRWALLGVDSAPGSYIFISFAMSLVLLVGGMYYFRRTESAFADLL